MEKKYNLSSPTDAEKEAFMKDFQEVLNKHSMYFEPIPNYSRKSIEDPWTVVCSIFLQKKTEVVEKAPDNAKPVDIMDTQPVPSTDVEVNPALGN